MKYPIFLILSASLFGQEAAPAQPAAAVTPPSDRSVLTIDPKGRAGDYVQVFDFLRKDKPTQKVMIRLANGSSLANISEITVAQNGTLLIVKFLSTSGAKVQIVPVEELMEISYSP